HEPVKWISPDGEKWVLSNLASQQTLMRTLDGLSEITGDAKYREAAMKAIRYAFDHLQAPNGLLYWGHITAYDASNDTVYSKNSHHTFKLHYPYYEMMWKVDSNATREFIEAFWSAHILDWSNRDMNRIGYFSQSLEEPWNHEYKGGPTFFKSKWNARAFVVTGSSLIHAGTVLYKLSGQQEPLVWSKRLAKRYVDSRHPKTGISAYLYNNSYLQLGDDLKEHFVDPRTSVFPYIPFEYTHLYYPEEVGQVHEAFPWMGIFLVGEMLGEKGKEFTRWALEEFTAWGKVSYRKKDNSFVPILTDGTNLEGYVWKGRPRGVNVAKPCPTGPSFFWAYSVACRITGDNFMWKMVRDIALANGFGDIGKTRAHTPELQTDTTCSHVYGLLGFLELYEKTKKPAYLEMARYIGDNILLDQFHKGFFVPSKRHIYTRFDCFEPLALLCLHAATKSKTGSVPQVWPSWPLFVPPYRYKEKGVDRRVIYALTESPEPPMSLQEAAAIGDVELVSSLLDKGVGVDSWDDPFKKTALHRAAISGHKDVVELLLAKGADIEVGKFHVGTALHYATEKGHKEIVELLIANGADVNVKDGRGRTPIDLAMNQGRKEIAKLLLSKGCDVSLHTAAYIGDLQRVEEFIDD
ncbi:MAG: ankyrin repeat domain-containing protein, partial [Desulfobacteraceae bacterium]|nr:ankyrin repeat domain-containing protein [Desulfobacteraceae bacterium]